MNFPRCPAPPERGSPADPVYGIVLWSSPQREQCVIWCQDSEQLAYASSMDDLVDGEWPPAGSLVQLKLQDMESLRIAREVRRLPGSADAFRLLGG